MLLLPAVVDGLFEDAVFIAQPIAHGRQRQRGHGIQKARRQTSQPAIAQPGVRLLFEKLEEINMFLLCRLPDKGVEQEIGDVIGERTPNQVLHREIVNTLGVFPGVVFFGADPALRQEVADRAGQSLETFARDGGAGRDDVVKNQVALIGSIAGTRKLDGATAVLLEKFLQAVSFIAK